MRRALMTVAIALAIALPPRAYAQVRVGDQLALARVCASEIGLHAAGTDVHTAECAAIARVLAGRSSTIASAAARYSGRVFDRDRAGGRAWVVFLDAEGREPAHWPRSVRWSHFRARWLALYAAAGRIVRGELADTCVEDVDHWGMRSGVDLERAQRFGWTEVDCGATRNAFWRARRRRGDG